MSKTKVPKRIKMRSSNDYNIGDILDVCGNKLKVIGKKLWRAPILKGGEKERIYIYTLIDNKYMKRLEARRT